MAEELRILIPTLTAMLGCVFGYLGARRNMIKDTESKTSEITTVIVKLETINNCVSKIESSLETLKSEQSEFRERLALVEASAKSAHHRLDNFEKHLQGGE